MEMILLLGISTLNVSGFPAVMAQYETLFETLSENIEASHEHSFLLPQHVYCSCNSQKLLVWL